MLLNNKGIPPKNWERALARGKTTELQDFVVQMTGFNLSNSVFVDCTASDDVVSMYENVMRAGVTVVTPNKGANSGLFANYRKLHNLAPKNKKLFLQEMAYRELKIIPERIILCF
jgi:aspartokinase/homoserine dehydrogenase 1